MLLLRILDSLLDRLNWEDREDDSSPSWGINSDIAMKSIFMRVCMVETSVDSEAGVEEEKNCERG